MARLSVGEGLAASALKGGGWLTTIRRTDGHLALVRVVLRDAKLHQKGSPMDLYRVLAVLREPPFILFRNISSEFLLLKAVFPVVLEGQQDPCSQWQRVWCCVWAWQFCLSAFSSWFLGKEPASRNPFTNHPHPSSLLCHLSGRWGQISLSSACTMMLLRSG